MNALNGYKTYFIAAIAFVDLVGVFLGWWEYDAKRLGAYGFAGLVTLRSGVKNDTSK